MNVRTIPIGIHDTASFQEVFDEVFAVLEANGCTPGKVKSLTISKHELVIEEIKNKEQENGNSKG